MWALLIASTLAGPMGPFDDGVAFEDTGIEPATCDDAWPYALVQLPDAPSLYFRWDPRRSWGTPDLIDAIVEATSRVALEYPTSDPVFVGDMSLRQGGPLPPHRYHSDGRSADIGLFVDGRQPVSGFVDVHPSQLDLELQWTLIEGFLVTGKVEHILIDQGHIDRLVRWLRETDRLSEDEIARIFPPPNAPRLWAMRGIVRAAARHRDHMHVRLGCDE